MTEELHREGFEYVVCPECGSEILTEGIELDWGLITSDTYSLSFWCDWEPCSADFWSEIQRGGATEVAS